MTPDQRKFFFIHVMKTAGATLRQHIRANFRDDQIYPLDQTENDRIAANHSLDHLTSITAQRRDRICVFMGHFPYVAVELLGMELTTVTVLRDPVERTLSYLRHCKRFHPEHRSLPLEEIYEDPFFFPCFIKDHQAKIFAFTRDDHPTTYMELLDVDSSRLKLAKANLERVDVIGTQDRFEALLAELEDRFGWRRGCGKDRNVSSNAGGRVPASFRRRIAEDNQADMDFFQHARLLCDRRRTPVRRRIVERSGSRQ